MELRQRLEVNEDKHMTDEEFERILNERTNKAKDTVLALYEELKAKNEELQTKLKLASLTGVPTELIEITEACDSINSAINKANTMIAYKQEVSQLGTQQSPNTVDQSQLEAMQKSNEMLQSQINLAATNPS